MPVEDAKKRFWGGGGGEVIGKGRSAFNPGQQRVYRPQPKQQELLTKENSDMGWKARLAMNTKILDGRNREKVAGMSNRAEIAKTMIQGRNQLQNTALSGRNNLATTEMAGKYGIQKQGIAGQYDLKKQNLANLGDLAEQRAANEGSLANTTQAGQNALATTKLAGQYGIRKQGLANTGDIARQQVANEGSMQETEAILGSRERVAGASLGSQVGQHEQGRYDDFINRAMSVEGGGMSLEQANAAFKYQDNMRTKGPKVANRVRVNDEVTLAEREMTGMQPDQRAQYITTLSPEAQAYYEETAPPTISRRQPIKRSMGSIIGKSLLQ